VFLFLQYFFDNLIDLCPLQAATAIGLISKSFYLIHAFSSRDKGRHKVFHFCHCTWRRGYRILPASAGLGSFTANWEREVLKRKLWAKAFSSFCFLAQAL
jgi:hypothetical protein